MNIDEMKEQQAILNERKRNEELHVTMSPEEARAERLKRPCRIREIGNGEFELIGVSREDAEDEELMEKYNRAILLRRARMGNNKLYF